MLESLNKFGTVYHVNRAAPQDIIDVLLDCPAVTIRIFLAREEFRL